MSHSPSNSSRRASLERRQALSTAGKAAIKDSAERTRNAPATTASAPPVAAAHSAVPAAPAPRPVVQFIAPQNAQVSVARKASLARRIAMSQAGKSAVASTDRIRPAPTQKSAAAANGNGQVGDSSAKQGCGCGCKGKRDDAAVPAANVSANISSVVSSQAQQNLMKKVAMNSTRAASLARRQAMSTKGKTALKGGAVSEASAARAANPALTSRELAQTLRSQRSVKGKTCTKQNTTPTGPGRIRRKLNEAGAAQDAPWKVGASNTATGQTVTGTMVDRALSVTGNEASTCRSVTGTEYMGADVFKEFCQTDATPSFNRVAVTSTATGNSVTGNEVGRSTKVTGDEPGTCKRVTGTEYISAEQAQNFCGSPFPASPAKHSRAETTKGKAVTGNNVGRSSSVTGDETGANRQLTGTQYMQPGDTGAVPAKVAISNTLRGGSVSGTTVGRSNLVTGDEPGSCQSVTGDEYISHEQYSKFCKTTPAPQDQKVGISNTLKGKSVTGTMTGRSDIVTGDEPGTCQSVTGTPYAGAEQVKSFCSTQRTSMAMARSKQGTTNVGPSMTGIQPGIGGTMTGDAKGVCEPVTGTPYVGADQMVNACPATASTPASPDFPQQLNAGQQPWGNFSVSGPAAEAQKMRANGAVTGSTYEGGNITGPFGMADGKITGTEQARFGGARAPMPEPIPATAESIDGRIKSRVTGEGMDAGQKITGDDWDRGDRVTGTEGMSATRRNPTRRGPANSMAIENKRNEEVALPVSKVTGSSGNTQNGSLITYSGGARG